MKTATKNVSVDSIPAAFSFCAGTTSEHGLSVGMFRENAGLHWSGVLPA